MEESLSVIPMTTAKRCVFCLMMVGALNCAQKTLMPRTISSKLARGRRLSACLHFKPGLHLEPSPASTPWAWSSILRASARGVMVLGMWENAANDAFIGAAGTDGAAEAMMARRARILPVSFIVISKILGICECICEYCF